MPVATTFAADDVFLEFLAATVSGVTQPPTVTTLVRPRDELVHIEDAHVDDDRWGRLHIEADDDRAGGHLSSV